MGEDWLSESLGKIFRKMGSSYENAKKEFKDGYKNSIKNKTTTSENENKKEPFVDIFKTKNKIKILIEAPGAKEDQIHLGIYNEDKLHVYIPSTYEDYSTDIELPTKIKKKKARYRYKNGVIAISLETKR